MEFDDIYYEANPQRSYVYLEFVTRFDGHTGIRSRVIFELFDDIVPKTARNFKALCNESEKWTKDGVVLSYQGTCFHRVVRGFVIQGGDNEWGDGTGGRSIDNSVFDDESFEVKHDQPFLLSMANKGPNTNASQFFITLAPAPQLDGRNVVFGRVIGGKSYLRALELVAVDDNDRPLYAPVIEECGHLTSNAKIRVRPEDDGTGDLFEKSVLDEPQVDLDDPASVFRVVGAIKEIGTRQFKAGKNLKALEKYRKGCNYLEDYFPDDLNDDDLKTLVDLKVSLYLNVALTSIKLGVGDTAIKAASEALQMDGLGPREKAKAYYRRGNGYLLVRNEEDAIADLEMAKSFAPTDSAITALLKKAYEARAHRKKNQKAAMAKLFTKDEKLSGIFSDIA
ncbi:hypothetical protein TRICI_005038 [Trichomonascus ciferrii]|uniref:peptidylprolyl isomerase n=1 Tax=Trichomonascus ciferrii TaxID=44093 RepID=A0A642UWT1_9ASCO|nr:hypothetical protein TRICI_005038 [Trichomonascus ciferrii]